jgi:hypothetical protein
MKALLLMIVNNVLLCWSLINPELENVCVSYGRSASAAEDSIGPGLPDFSFVPVGIMNRSL